MNIESIAAFLIALISSLVLSFWSHLTKNRKEQDRIIGTTSNLNLKGYLDKSIEELNKTQVLWKNPKYADEVIDNLKINFDFAAKQLVFITSPKEKEEAERKVREIYEDLKKRIEEIEKRFPKEATLEKVASINDAILATSIDSMNESLKRLEVKMLSKWDVAKVVFQILASLGALTGLILAILQYMKK